MTKGMGGHQSAKMKNDEWLTPPHILRSLGQFDLDPCAPVKRPWEMAKHHYSVMDDGLCQERSGRVWCNPPYGAQAALWLHRCAEHKNATALIFARTETKMFFDHVWDSAAALLFIEGRLYFHNVHGERAAANAGAPSVLVAYDETNAEIMKESGIPGKYIVLN